MEDPRVPPVEDNLEAFLDTIVRSGAFHTGSDPDVSTYWSDIAFPLLNGIGAARFAAGRVETRAREVVASYVERGLPFIWWATPSGHAEELETVLPGLGLTCQPVPGMYRSLDGPVAPRLPAATTIEQVGNEKVMPTMLAGFGMPAELSDPMLAFMSGLEPARAVNLVASTSDRPVGCGTLWLTGKTAGLYNIAVLEEARGRGIGYAVTASLLNVARERGATHAILHSSDLGRPVYERLGFEVVCRVPQFVWTPPAAGPASEPKTTVL
jgi:GNAT superfamily N-acetyltransferase